MIKQNYAVNNFNFSTLEQAELFENIITRNKFNNKQKKIIASGIKKRLDVSIYSFKYFKAEQMKQVQLGLENNLDVSIYSNPNIEWKEMERIRLELESNNE
jgi:hypothetical protein